MEKTGFKSHISGQYNRNLEELFNQVLEMGGLVESQLENAVEAIKGENRSLAKQVKQLDKAVNKDEIEIDRLCARVLARQQPTASDLRLVVSAIRIAVDLERIGDEAVNTSKLAIKMAKVKEIPCDTLPGFNGLMEIIAIDLTMLKKVLNSFAQLDTSALSEIVDYETHVDAIKAKALVEIQYSLNNNTEALAEYIMQMIYSIRAAERISSHILNICESIVYLVKGLHVRNMNAEKLKQFIDDVNAESV
ncbi:phosphate transport system regulatory protein PhoU [Thiomicrorhabdus immobilis]|uniref:Phosphate-specific transport system accessory protein PhoU n=1 Tax=Thiomicrorhabdus immobilis TaxID=2791037 RepID=A0ABM7MBX0_9GAMM|nr:phosphate signaling complex protein PhoU [Thiomicrorhabdus immobilis]BCN92839.1 phosphate transport system regulatory protein PhoU [Thiomicrorhabdus immobilis]